MTSNEFKIALTAEPFRPFRLHFGSGKTIEIVNPGLVVVTGGGRTALAAHPDDDGFDIIDIMLVERIEYPNGSGWSQDQRGGGSNGGPPSDRR